MENSIESLNEYLSDLERMGFDRESSEISSAFWMCKNFDNYKIEIFFKKQLDGSYTIHTGLYQYEDNTQARRVNRVSLGKSNVVEN